MKSKKVIILVAVIVIFVGVIVFLFDSFVSKIANEKALELDLPDFITHGDISVSSIGNGKSFIQEFHGILLSICSQ